MNSGVSFGLFQGIPIAWIGVVWVLVVVLLVKEKTNLARLGLLMIAIGGLMNFWQRLIMGSVVDPWLFLGLIYNNLADYIIVVGLLIYGYTNFVRR
ncbi:MAG: signal peptidase II [bacterium]